MNSTTEFDHLVKQAFKVLFPLGSDKNYFKARPSDDCYQGAVKPDYVLPNAAWVDFKLHVSYRESHGVAWKPSALYSSLRKYVDHVANSQNRLNIVYGRIHGSIDDVRFPIMRGNKILIKDKIEFKNLISMKPALQVISRLQGTDHEWIVRKVQSVISK